MSASKVGDLVFRTKRSLPLSLHHLAISVHVIDFVLIVLTSIASGCAYRFATSSVAGEIDQFSATGAVVASLVIAISVFSGTSHPEELLKPAKQLRRLLFAWLLALSIVLGLAFTWKVSSDVSRGAFLTFFVAGFPVMVGNRLLWHRLLQVALARERLKARRVAVLYPAGEDLAEMAKQFDTLARYGYRALWKFAIPDRSVDGVGDLVSTLPKYLRGTDVDEVVVLGDWANVPDLLDLERLAFLPVPVRFLPVGAARLLLERPSERLGGSVLVEIQRGSLSGAERAAKAAFDRLAASAALLVLAPLVAICAALIAWEDGGPVFFRQVRRGYNGRPFQIWKFRSMAVVAKDAGFVPQAVLGDKRVTRIGRWLRRTSIDEIPQLINVLRGEMSLVGPRPHALSHDDHFDALIENYFRRQHVRPGLTGWAQISGARGETQTIEDMKRRVELDIWYVQNWSFGRDLWIILLTLWHVFATDEAY